ncbi:hypothetical protein V8C86DRAFT_629467 [Haematococcus lacustris]
MRCTLERSHSEMQMSQLPSGAMLQMPLLADMPYAVPPCPCRRIVPNLAFVTLDNEVPASLHISAISSERLEKVEEVFAVGDELKAVVVGNTYMGRSIAQLSTKVLELVPGQMKHDKQVRPDG